MNQLENSEWLRSVIREFVESSPENVLRDSENSRAFDTPLVGFSAGDDPIFEAFRIHVGEFHWTPLEAFLHEFPDSGEGENAVGPEELSVISWVLPQTEATRTDNRHHFVYPSEKWARARIFGEEFNVALRRHVVQSLMSKGRQAVAPVIQSKWERKDSERYVFASTWSERHIAYSAGLGAFGLCDGLITPVGKAMRVGSVVARISLTPTPRPYKDHHEYCLFFVNGRCGKCIERCPAGAITENGHDKVKCRTHIRSVTAKFVRDFYGFDGYGCGMCQTGVPCESKIPVKVD